jgi:hypothetical protein
MSLNKEEFYYMMKQVLILQNHKSNKITQSLEEEEQVEKNDESFDITHEE